MSANIWIPLLFSSFTVIVVLLSNAFFFGKNLEQKATKAEMAKELEKKLDITVFEKNNEVLNDKISLKANKEAIDIYMKLTSDSYTALEERLSDIEDKQDKANEVNAGTYREVSNKLSEISSFMKSMKENCDKEICKKGG